MKNFKFNFPRDPHCIKLLCNLLHVVSVQVFSHRDLWDLNGTTVGIHTRAHTQTHDCQMFGTICPFLARNQQFYMYISMICTK